MGKQVDRLAAFILCEIDGEPSTSEGAVECAIRIMRKQKQEIQWLYSQLPELPEIKRNQEV